MRVSGVSAMTNFPAACVAAVLLASTQPLAAQTAPVASSAPVVSRTGKAQIAGVVVDSLNARYLSGADIVIEGANVSLQTDSVGRFVADSLPPGTYQVGVFHPLLDTLGIAIASKPFHLGPDSSSFVILAIPSVRTLVGRYCRAQSDSLGASALIGHVADPETLRPIANAQVSVAWAEIEISKTAGFRRTPHLATAATDASGAFAICGLPSPMQATLQARRGAIVTAEIPVSIGDRPVELVARSLLLSAVDSMAKSGNAAVSGTVLLDGSDTNAGSRVELEGTDIVAMTNAKGEFTMRNLPSGTRVILARHLGFAAQSQSVDLSSREEQHVTIKLPKYVSVMDPVLVVARASAALDKVGFSQRQKSGMGYYLGPDRLQNMHPTMVTDILRRVPGLRVSYTPHGDVVSSSRSVGNSCVQYFLDDMPYQEMTPGDINQFVGGNEVVAVEVYQGPETPAQYIRPGYDCTTIVLWTRFKIRG